MAGNTRASGQMASRLLADWSYGKVSQVTVERIACKSAATSSLGYRVAMEHTDAMLRHNPGCWDVLCRKLRSTQDRIRNMDWSRSTNEDEAFTKAPYERYDCGCEERERSMAASAAELSCVAYDPWPTINSTEHTTVEKLEAAAYISTQVAGDCHIARIMAKVKDGEGVMIDSLGMQGSIEGFLLTMMFFR
ncbi:hypothetical protein AK812_SmicGene7382 [Symbiodinium microadriaticum]|uniref:Uncharacterized protein n=1 Tax=Symbiodinium microadriaticum TaxID=2951 RepID=A0A1Q9ENW2_SYMMI|nr:hypothetical protein AK812_SmicGene7382 [Symbiodinium microadriaticum]